MSDEKKQKKGRKKNKWMEKKRVYEMLEKRGLENLTEDIERSIFSLNEWGFGGESEASEAYYNILYNIPKEHVGEAANIVSEYIYNEKRDGGFNDLIGIGSYEIASYISHAFAEVPESRYEGALKGIRKNSRHSLRRTREFVDNYIIMSYSED